MKGFTFLEDYYLAISSLADKSRLRLYEAICAYCFGYEEQKLSGVENAIFALIKPRLDLAIKRSISGSKTKSKRNQNEIKTQSNEEQNEIKRENSPIKEERPKKERTKEKNTQEENITLVREKSKKERNLKDNNNNACTREGACYEDIIKHYAGDVNEETRSAIWKYIQYFQAKTGCFILNDQLKTFLVNLKNLGLAFEGGVLGCINEDGIGMSMIEVS